VRELPRGNGNLVVLGVLLLVIDGSDEEFSGVIIDM
jgi:hypothetical protein